MKKLTVLPIIFLCCILHAQQATIKGNIIDTASKQILSNSVITLLRSKDSTLYKFTRSKNNGEFELNKLSAGNYILLVTYPNYADYVDTMHLTDTTVFNIGKIILTLKANLLKEVIVRQQIGSIRMKGDTTEFTADSFKVQPNATVEDLLKKLPGIQVDKNGQITAQGEKVQQILVDGEEFFGDDPTLVTQNLRADMVDKVQVYDKKSDQATFTGIDDGQKQKTINLKLKDDKKNGYFGKLNASAGSDGYHDSQGMINAFKKKQKFAAYGIVSNTGTSGLNWQDRDNYGESFASNVDIDESGGGFFIFTGNDDELDSWDGRYNGQGFPLVQTGGLHYNNKWNDDKSSINLNYKILQLYVNGNSATNSEYILPDTLYFNNQRENFKNSILRNRINGNYEYQFDSTSSIKISADGGDDHKITSSQYYTESLASDSSLVNQGNRKIATTGDNRTVNSNLLWRKKLKKKGRTISFNLKENYLNNSSNGFLYADNNFYSGGILSSKQITDQYKTTHSESILLDSKLTYTEPLTKVSSLVLNYGVVINNSNSARNSFNKDGDGKYSMLDSLYSNNYQFNVFTNRGGINYSLFQKKLKLNFGSNVGFTNFDQKNLRNDSSISRNFINWYPQANFSYQFTQQRRIMFRYNGNTQQPTIQQIQPVLTNDDPLNISIGNPNLKPAFQNNIWLSFFDFKVLTERNVWASVSYNFTENAISNKSYVDSLARNVYQAVNLNGNHNFSAYIDYGLKLKKIDTRIGFNGNFNASRNVNIVNNILNVTNSGNYTLGININKEKEKKFNIDFNSSATYTTSTSSVQQNIKTQYWSFDISPNFDVHLPKKFQIHADGDFNFRQKTTVFNTAPNAFLLNAWIGKKFLKNDALLIKAAGYDLLNQNIGFDRTVSSNYISQNTYSTIQRHFMLSVVWNFNKAGTKAPGSDNQ
ncbi:MAG: outer membrane beta-barrel protein [Chitinophagaceae bacterium]